jgi:putative tryptophan/tyrosine transport system substrate-binding protein
MPIQTGRREFIATLLGAAACPLGARAQQATAMPRMAMLSPGRPEPPDSTLNSVNAFLQGLRDLGYTNGKNITIERRFAN